MWYAWGAVTPAIVAFTRRLPLADRHRAGHALAHVGAGLAAIFVTLLAVTAVRSVVTPAAQGGLPFWTVVSLQYRRVFAAFLFVYAAIVGAVHAVSYYRAMQARALREAQLETMLAQARLDVLAMQLHPHFLFNTLHAISALMTKDVPAARRMIARLSDLLRASLETDPGQEVPLRDEIQFLMQYVDIQRTRFQDRLTVDVRIAPEVERVPVPCLLLQPLVENAIRHGVARRAGAERVEVTARLAGDRLELRVRDDGAGLPADGTAVREGVGLRNTRARLRQLYGDAHRFALENVAAGGAQVTIELPAVRPGGEVNAAPPAASAAVVGASARPSGSPSP